MNACPLVPAVYGDTCDGSAHCAHWNAAGTCCYCSAGAGIWSTGDVLQRTSLTPRRLTHWVAQHAIRASITHGEGSGRYHRWSDLDLACLGAISTVAISLGALGVVDVPVVLVARLWRQLRTADVVEIVSGGVTIRAQRPAVTP